MGKIEKKENDIVRWGIGKWREGGMEHFDRINRHKESISNSLVSTNGNVESILGAKSR